MRHCRFTLLQAAAALYPCLEGQQQLQGQLLTQLVAALAGEKHTRAAATDLLTFVADRVSPTWHWHHQPPGMHVDRSQ